MGFGTGICPQDVDDLGRGFHARYAIDFTGPNGTVLRASLRVLGANKGSSSSKPSPPKPDSG